MDPSNWMWTCLWFLTTVDIYQALHCHRLHDHSADVLLTSQKHSSSFDDGSEHTFVSAAKLVQPQPHQSSDSMAHHVKRHRSEHKRTDEESSATTVMSFCPERCVCNFTHPNNRLQVVCSGHFEHDFPLAELRRDVEVLHIEPQDVKIPNEMTLGPIYQHLRLLKVLRIRNSGIPNIGRRTMWGLSGLEILDLSHNRLSNVIEPNFDGLYSLKELYLNDNRIKSMVSAAFRHASRLHILSLARNKIEELAPRIFYKLQSLKRLDLSGNRLQYIDGAIFVDIPNLETFACNHCSLFQLRLPEHVFMKKLHTLAVSSNTIRAVSDVHENFLVNVQHLDLSMNRLVELKQQQFDHMRLLKHLNVASNNISSIDDCTLCNTSIQVLDMSSNAMRQLNIHMVPYDVRSLLELHLSGNWLSMDTIEGLVSRMPSLEKIGLDETGMVSVPSSLFYYNPRLKSVNMSGNFLISLDTSVFSHLDWLEVLDLSSNYFLGMEADFFNVIRQRSRLKMVYLQNNQFVCDQCHIAPLLEWLDSSLQYWGACFQRSNPLCLKCAKPDHLLHMPIEELRNEKLPECNNVQESAVPYNDDLPPYYHPSESNQQSSSTDSGLVNSPYFAGGLTGILLLIVAIIALAKYRHYGVYLTHEEDQLVDGDDVLRNPVVVLDKNSESYINLRYPVHSTDESELKKK